MYSLKSVFKGASIYTIGQTLIKGSNFFLIPLYTRFLTPADYGVIGYLQAILPLLATVLMFGFYGAQTRYFYEAKESGKEIGGYLFSINIFLIPLILIVCILLQSFGKSIYSLFGPEEIAFNPFIIIIIWTTFVQIINQLVISYYLASKRYKTVAIMQFFQFLFIIGFTLLLIVVYEQGALGKVKGILYGQILFLIVFYQFYIRKFTFNFSFDFIKYSFSFGTPIIFHHLGAVALVFIDRIILERFVSIEDLGIYTLGFQIGMIIHIITSSINKSWQPNYFDLMSSKTKDQAYESKRALYLWIAGLGAICLCGILWSREVIFILTPRNFHASAGIVPFIIFGYLINALYQFFSSPIFYFKKTKILPFMTLLAVVIKILASFILIPIYGIYGAAYATIVGFLVRTVHSYFISKSLFNPEFDLGKIFIVISLIFFGCVGLQFSEFTVYNEILKFSYFIAFITIVYLLFRNYYGDVLEKATIRLKKSLHIASSNITH